MPRTRSCTPRRPSQVGLATDDGADAVALVGSDGEGDVEAVDEADAVGEEVGGAAVVEADLGKGGGGGAAGSVALEAAAAVSGEAGEVRSVLGAVGAGPDAPGPGLGGSGEGAVGEGVEEEAAPLEDGVAGVGLDGGPDGEGAVVDESEDGGLRVSGVNDGSEDEECGGGEEWKGVERNGIDWVQCVSENWWSMLFFFWVLVMHSTYYLFRTLFVRISKIF
ncbi:unnamed protein product [Malus baccata var. baccata]